VARVEVLGPVQARVHDGEAAAIGRTPSRRVLAHLAAVAPTPVSHSALIETAWQNRPPSTPDSSLRMMITRMRRSLGHVSDRPVLIHGVLGYSFTRHIEIDRLEFEDLLASSDHAKPEERTGMLETAVDLWRGPPFSDFEGRVFESEARRLENAYLDALLGLQELQIEQGRAQVGLGRIETHRLADPLDERFAALSIRSHYALGDQVRALAVYEEVRRELRDQLGVEPTPELQRTRLAVLQHDERLLTRQSSRAPTTAETSTSIVNVIAAGLASPVMNPAPSDQTDEPVQRLLHQARASAKLGHWQDATSTYLHAVASQTDSGNHNNAATISLELATIVWDPGLSDLVRGTLEDAMGTVTDPVLLAEVRLCLAGGLHRTGNESEASTHRSSLVTDLDLVRGNGAPTRVAWATIRARDALSGTITPEESLELSASVERLDMANDDQISSQNHRAIFADQLRLDRRAAAERTMQRLRTPASQPQRAVDAFGALTVQNCLNLIHGRFDAVQAGLADALAFRGRLPEATLDQVVLGQSFWLCREMRDQANAEAHLEGALAIANADTSTPLWLVAAGLLACDLEQDERALDLVVQADQSHDLKAIPPGSHRTGILAFTAEILASAAARQVEIDTHLAESIALQLNADPCQGVLLGWPTVFAGPKARFEGFAAAATGDAPAASLLFATALRSDNQFPPHRRRSIEAEAILH